MYKKVLILLLASIFWNAVLAIQELNSLKAELMPIRFENTPILRKGVGYHEPMTWGVMSQDLQSYAWPPYQSERYLVDQSLMKLIRRAGFDHVRLSVDPGPFVSANGEQREQLIQVLLRNIVLINKYDLAVVVDLHPIDMIKLYSCSELIRPEKFQLLLKTIRSIALALNVIGASKVALEPFNEPCMDPDSDGDGKWNSYMKTIHDEIRINNKNVLIIISANRWGQLDGLFHLDVNSYRDSNVKFTFHYYNPFEYTHQGMGADGNLLLTRSFSGGIGFPSDIAGLYNFLPVFLGRLDALQTTQTKRQNLRLRGLKDLTYYFLEGGSISKIEKDFDKVARWALQNNILPEQIYEIIGEVLEPS